MPITVAVGAEQLNQAPYRNIRSRVHYITTGCLMFRFTIRELVLMAVTAAVTAGGMYAAWQADRALLALRLSQIEQRAVVAEQQAVETSKEQP